MKTLSLLFMLTMSGAGVCQQNPGIQQKKPVFYPDSVVIDFEKVFINPNNIKEVSVENNSGGGGKVHI